MTCPHCNADLTEWVKRLREEEDTEQYFHHLDECDRIAQYEQQQERIDLYLNTHPDERERILRSINEHRDEHDRTQEKNDEI